MKKSIATTLLATSALLALTAQATPLYTSAGFTAADKTVTFGETLAAGTVVTNQFTGVTFSVTGAANAAGFEIGDGAYSNATNVSGKYVDNFVGDVSLANVYKMRFASAVNAAGAFWEFNQNTQATFSAYLGGQLVESLVYTNTNCCTSAEFVGFQGIRFDELRMSNVTGFHFYMDNMSFRAADVPEPASLALFAVGALGFAGLRRRAIKK